MILIDASIAVKWLVDEPDRASALRVLGAGELIAAPDLFWSEVANVLRTKVKLNEMLRSQASEGLALVRDAIDWTIPTIPLAERALSLALLLDHPVYDCVYLACALREGAVLVTADEKFRTKCRLAGSGGLVLDAGEWLIGAAAPSERDLLEIRRTLQHSESG